MFCGSSNLSDKLFSSYNAIRLVVCNNCYCITAAHVGDQVPNVYDQALLHEDIFGTSHDNDHLYVEDSKNLINLITRDYPNYFGDPALEVVVDVCSGRGSLVKSLIECGYTAYGCEFSSKLVTAAKRVHGLSDSQILNINAWDLADFLAENSIKPTVLVFWHAIEHVENSLSLLSKLVSVCDEKLTLILQTPLPVPEYIFPEHLFFPSTETYHFIANQLELKVKHLHVISYNRFVTCVMSNKDIPQGVVYPREIFNPCFNVLSQLVFQLNAGLVELDKVTKDQYSIIVELEKCRSEPCDLAESNLSLSSDLSLISDILQKRLGFVVERENEHGKVENLTLENQRLHDKLLRAEAQLSLLKDLFLDKNEIGYL